MFSFILQFRGEWYIFRQEKWQPLNFLHCCGSYLQTRRKKLRRLWCYHGPVTGALKSQLFMIFMRYLLCTSEKSASLYKNGLPRKIIKRRAIARENFLNGRRPRLSATRRGEGPRVVRDDGRLDLAGQRAFGAAPPRVNTALCLCSQSLPRERKYLKPEPSA